MKKLWSKLFRWLGWASFLATVLFGLLGVYSGFFYSRAPDLAIQEVANTAVFSINERIEQLEIRYRGRELWNSGKTLTLLQLRIVNTGTAPILQTYFDGRALPGVAINNAEVLRADVVTATSPYLRTNLALVVTASAVSFRPVIIERSDYFVIRLLLLHDRASSPHLTSMGKLAGIRDIPYVPLIFRQEPSVLASAFSGGLLVQVLRLPAYFVGTILVLLAFVLPVAFGSSHFENRRRKRFVAAALAVEDTTDPLLRHFLKQYEKFGPEYLRAVTATLRSPRRLQIRHPEDLRHGPPMRMQFEFDRRPLRDLQALGVITSEQDPKVDAEKAENVRRVITDILKNAPR